MLDVINYLNNDIRTVEISGQIWYSVVDVIAILSESNTPRKYWSDLKSKLKKEGSQVSENIGQFKLEAPDGKMRFTDCLNREGILRLIQSVPSPNAEPFKVWLAETGSQYIEEVENPELVYDRLIESYRQSGRDDEWIKLRLRSLSIRKDLTDTWQERGVIGAEYALLTDEIHKGVFDLNTREHRAYKNLDKKSGNLRDHMSNMELLFMSLGEEITKQLAEKFDAQGFDQNRDVAKEGGNQAGGSRKRLESKLGIKTITSSNYLSDE